jgi:hypothetical protein
MTQVRSEVARMYCTNARADLKGTVSRDFFTISFFIEHFPLGHWFLTFSVFAQNFEFAEISKCKVNSAVSMTPLKQKIFFAQLQFSSFCLQGLG